MNKFKISIKKGNGYIPLTLFSSEDSNHSPYSTFDETVNFGENSQATLKFSIAAYVDDLSYDIDKWESSRKTNPFLDLLECGRVIRFDMDNYFKIDFVITKRTPRKIGSNIIFDFECTDYFRFFMSKRGVGLTYPFDEDDIEQIVPQDIRFLAKKIMSAQESEWRVSNFLVASDFKEESTDLTKQVTFEVSGSNQYQALLDLAAKFNAELIVDYRFKTITFRDKNQHIFNGYYRTDVNVTNFGYSEDMSNSCNLLFVSGGTDEYDIAVTIPGQMTDNWRNYFRSLVDNNTNWDKFKEWGKSLDPPYKNSPFYYTYNNNNTYFGEQLEEDENYAKLADQMPHMQNFVYKFDWIKERGLIDNTTYLNMIDKLKEFTVPSIKYESVYPDVVLLGYNISSWLWEAKNNIDMAFSNYKLAKNQEEIDNNENIAKAKRVLEYGKLKETVIQLGGNDYIHQIYYDLVKELYAYKDLLAAKQESLAKVEKELLWADKNSNQYTALEGQKLGLEDDIEFLSQLINKTFNVTKEESNWTTTIIGQATGKYPFIFDCLKTSFGVSYEYAEQQYKNNKNLDKKFGALIEIVTDNEQEIKQTLRELRRDYGEYIQEGMFVDDVELDSFALYNKAMAQLRQNINIEKIDLSVIRADALEDCIVKSLEVGQYIRVVDNDLLPLLKTDKTFIKELRITGIDMQPRKPYDIKLTLEQMNLGAELLKRIVRTASKG